MALVPQSLASGSTALLSLREVISAYDLRAAKSLGQHFLLDPNITDSIAALAGDVAGRVVLEIGPGPGGLTRSLLTTKASYVLAVEKDERSVRLLQETLQPHYPDRLTVIEGDALTYSLESVEKALPASAEGAPVPSSCVIVANLPYNVASPLLIGWLKQLSHVEKMVLMFQKEVAERIVASPKSKAYGRLAMMSQWLCDVSMPMQIGAAEFTPPPKVDSAVVVLTPKKDPYPVSFEAMETLGQLLFSKRRKMLRQILKNHCDDATSDLERLGIIPTARPEELTPLQCCQLAEFLF